MSSLHERLNSTSNETFLGTGKEANNGRKVNHIETYTVNSIPHDRHRFTRFAGYLNKLSENLGDLALESCKRDCSRQLSYVHGKNVSKSDELSSLCISRCRNDSVQHKNISYVSEFFFCL